MIWEGENCEKHFFFLWLCLGVTSHSTLFRIVIGKKLMASVSASNQVNTLCLGVSEPISTAGPTEFDLIKTRELEKVGFWM